MARVTAMDIKQALQQLVARVDLSTDEMASAMREVMTGAATPAQIGAF
jgi:anthranilate phosphoribosyltransferase